MARTAAPRSDEPTQPRPTDAEGRLLDGFGLPIGGPARARALAGRPDPALADGDVAPDPVPTPSEEQ